MCITGKQVGTYVGLSVTLNCVCMTPPTTRAPILKTHAHHVVTGDGGSVILLTCVHGHTAARYDANLTPPKFGF